MFKFLILFALMFAFVWLFLFQLNNRIFDSKCKLVSDPKIYEKYCLMC